MMPAALASAPSVSGGKPVCPVVKSSIQPYLAGEQLAARRNTLGCRLTR